MFVPDNSRRVLLLNSSEEVLRLITWQRAACLLISERAEIPYNYEDFYTIPTPIGIFNLPSAVKMKDYVHIPYRRIAATRQNIFRRDNMICQYTGEKLNSKNATIDHVLPKARGGKHVWSNVVTCRRDINNKKSDKTPEEAGLKLISKPSEPTMAQLAINSIENGDREAWKRWRY